MCNCAFTPDATCANKSCYSRVVGRLNILSLLASFARDMGGASAGERLQSSKILFIPVSVKVWRCIVQLRGPHTAMIILSSIVVSDSLRSLHPNHVTTRASSWLVTAARIFAKVQIFQLVLQTPETLNLRESRHSRRLISANRTAGCLFASLHWLNM